MPGSAFNCDLGSWFGLGPFVLGMSLYNPAETGVAQDFFASGRFKAFSVMYLSFYCAGRPWLCSLYVQSIDIYI